MNVPIKDTPFSYYVKLLEEGTPFSFVRYGNGEWDCIFCSAKRTGSGSQSLTVPGLRKNMAYSVRNAPRDKHYMLGMQSKRYLESRGLWANIENWLGDSASDLQWHVGDVFHKASMKGQLWPLVKALKRRHVILVGPSYLSKIRRFIKVEKHIMVKSRDCFCQIASIRKQILDCGRGRIVSVSAGPMAKVLIYQLYSSIGDTDTLVDFGSLWDPYAGKKTRRYHRRLRGELIRKNVMGV